MILLASADKKDAANDVGLQILTLTGKSPLDMRIAGHPGGKKLAEIPLQSTLKLNEDVRVEMVWATPHLVVIRIGDAEEKAIQIPWVASRVEVTGSTGEVKLDPLVLGTMTP
jgi:hypothetical protein